MGTRTTIIAMVAGTALVIGFGRRHDAPKKPAPAPPKVKEEAWFPQEAAAEVFGAQGEPGPLFAGVTLGGPAPADAVQQRIEKFAKANHVEIDLQVIEDHLAAIHFSVTYGGCCGYEAADVLGRRLGRPTWSNCEGCTETWINNWTNAVDGVFISASVNVNTVTVRWEHTQTLEQVIDRAQQLVGADVEPVAVAAKDAWHNLEHHQFLLEVPWADARPQDIPPANRERKELGYSGTTDGDWRIREISFFARDLDEESLITRWGRPKKAGDVWTWKKPDRLITADFNTSPPTITIANTKAPEHPLVEFHDGFDGDLD